MLAEPFVENAEHGLCTVVQFRKPRSLEVSRQLSFSGQHVGRHLLKIFPSLRRGLKLRGLQLSDLHLWDLHLRNLLHSAENTGAFQRDLKMPAVTVFLSESDAGGRRTQNRPHTVSARRVGVRWQLGV